MWELREEVRDDSEEACQMQSEWRMEGGRDVEPRVLGVYSTSALARAALSTRLQPLFGGGDCFTTPCHDKLEMQQLWNQDGSGEVVVSLKKLPGERDYVPDEKLVLTVGQVRRRPSQLPVDQPPPRADQQVRACDDSDDGGGDEDEVDDCWGEFLYAVRPPSPEETEEEAAAEMAAADAMCLQHRRERAYDVV